MSLLMSRDFIYLEGCKITVVLQICVAIEDRLSNREVAGEPSHFAPQYELVARKP